MIGQLEVLPQPEEEEEDDDASKGEFKVFKPKRELFLPSFKAEASGYLPMNDGVKLGKGAQIRQTHFKATVELAKGLY